VVGPVALNLVTGATGFIGGHLVRRLVREGQPTRVLCRPGSEDKLPASIARRLEIVRGDLLDRESLMRAASGATRIYHCAGHGSHWGSRDTFELVNVRGTRWLLEAAARRGVQRFVHLSAVAALGMARRLDDDSPHATSRHGYAYSKARGEQIALAYHRERGLPVTILRPALVYGVGGTWLEEPLSMLERDRLVLLGGGRGTCHPCYIENLVEAMLLAAAHPEAVGQAFIVGDGESMTFRDYFAAIATIAGKPAARRSRSWLAAQGIAAILELVAFLTRSPRRPRLTRGAIAMVTRRSELSTDKIHRVLGFEPRYSFACAIDRLRAWYALTPRAGGSATARSPARSSRSPSS
jgi:nucleoside-diphosphate-sugar epimerase